MHILFDKMNTNIALFTICTFASFSPIVSGAQLVADGIPPPGSTYPPGTVVNGGIKVGDMLIVFFSVIMGNYEKTCFFESVSVCCDSECCVSGAMGLGQMMSVNPDFALARASAYAVLKVINRDPLIDGRPNAPGMQSTKTTLQCYKTTKTHNTHTHTLPFH
jgi:hypothetical protein